MRGLSLLTSNPERIVCTSLGLEDQVLNLSPSDKIMSEGYKTSRVFKSSAFWKLLLSEGGKMGRIVRKGPKSQKMSTILSAGGWQMWRILSKGNKMSRFCRPEGGKMWKILGGKHVQDFQQIVCILQILSAADKMLLSEGDNL